MLTHLRPLLRASLPRLSSLATARPHPTTLAARPLSTTPSLLRDFNRPSPPPLPAEDQAEFERLQKAAEVAVPAGLDEESPEALLKAIDELEHRDLRKGAKPEFEGDTNPVTGEVGGPKRDPFQASKDDWAFGGRVTDF